MLYQRRIDVSPVLERICTVLILSSRGVGDVVSSYALAHHILAYNDHLSLNYQNVDMLAAEVDEQFQLLKRSGSVSVINIANDNPAEEPIAYYRIEDSGFFLA